MIEQSGIPAIPIDAPDPTTALLSHLRAWDRTGQLNIEVIEDEHSACDYIVRNEEHGIRVRFSVKPKNDGRENNQEPRSVDQEDQISRSSWVTTLILCLLLTGAHRIYVGKTGTGIVMLVLIVFAWCDVITMGMGGGAASLIIIIPLLIWSVIDLVKILRGEFTDKHGNRIREKRQ
ncbi:MAG: TM2 domain-containing protein [Bacteroidetes bacterium]|nr:TM2 domain-containing protein [Bacteroidota bacterium]